jgi:hypothetical protein
MDMEFFLETRHSRYPVWLFYQSSTLPDMGNYTSQIRCTNEEAGEYFHRHKVDDLTCDFKFLKGEPPIQAGGVLLSSEETGVWLSSKTIREFARLLNVYENAHKLTESTPLFTEEIKANMEDEKRAEIKKKCMDLLNQLKELEDKL